ncbi:MAG: hypothetical protein V5A59_14190, partial [Bacteroidales bacterium]
MGCPTAEILHFRGKMPYPMSQIIFACRNKAYLVSLSLLICSNLGLPTKQSLCIHRKNDYLTAGKQIYRRLLPFSGKNIFISHRRK